MGITDKISGRVKKAAGDLADDPTLQALPARDRIVLHLRFVEDLTQAEIAERVGVSQMHVSRLIRQSISRLRAEAEESGPPA